MRCDFIIVGQGLAGSALAYRLHRRGKRVLVYDLPGRNNCSAVAAGLFNPVTEVRSMKKTWMADQLFPHLFAFYREVESYTGAHFFHPLPLYRPFASPGEQNEWMSRSAGSEYSAFISEVVTEPRYSKWVVDPFGGLLLNNAGYINTNVFVAAVRDVLALQGMYREMFFDESRLEADGESVRYDDVEAAGIVFCQGVESMNNKWFGWLPLSVLKGETLSITASLPESLILNRGIYLVPDERDKWRAGATYFYRDVDAGVTEEAREELEMKLSHFLRVPYEIVSQSWGFRPASPDRRPMLGPHPGCRRVTIFNGLGTKGVSLAPFFSDVLAAWLCDGGMLPGEASIGRYKSLYSKPA